MSTFNGLVDEFPEIRIDYFRHHSNKIAPQACFLSHVHRDHLQGLETLKMPFVYCSSTTKKILLQMEKYPHRINFAKGILEARKQTYKSLKLVLRPIPLETPVDIELGPKSKIRVTLFDANHCPGAVMFLIEGRGKSILYTGDIRAEIWWVESIIRNPILLPYSCGARRLDCIYLDTTFASRDDIYEHFPSKADGLKELLTEVNKHSSASIFYFRSWTLGYEDVWIALSNFLRARVHVDQYQLRIFRALSDDACSRHPGPALTGFEFGNQHQVGCLTDDVTALIHSCEPGTECHSNIQKQKHAVWITPIISRLKDGTKVHEIGAGGGGGDLYQTPELELIDIMATQAVQKLSGDNTKQKEALDTLGQIFATARAKGTSKISLDGLGLDQEEEVSLQKLVRLLSRREEAGKTILGSTETKTIHFAYSRHSSFSELRHLVSSFRPRDICPCTVDLDSWSEEVSMQSLFGDLCSETLFRHDQMNRKAAEERQQGTRGQKRKREADTDSQRGGTDSSLDSSEAFVSAETSLPRHDDHDPQGQSRAQSNGAPKETIRIPTPVRKLQIALANRLLEDLRHVDSPGSPCDSSKSDTKNPISTIPPDHSENDNATSPPSSAFEPDDEDQDSHPHRHSSLQTRVQPHSAQDRRLFDCRSQIPISQLDGLQDHTSTTEVTQATNATEDEDRRTALRTVAYRAAQATLAGDTFSAWDDLRIRSVGWKGHTEEEMVL